MPDNFHNEEDVRVKFLLPYLKERGYKSDCIKFEQAIEVHEGRKRKVIYADAVVYASPKSDAPILLCETKGPSEILDKAVREQAISYARLLPKIAPLVLITNGSQVQVYQSVTKTRISQLPLRKDLQRDVVNLVLSKDVQDALRTAAKHELFIIDDVQVFKRILKSCHNEIRNNEGVDATVAFDEMAKVLFCKLYEEKTNQDNNRFRLAVFDDSLKRLGVNVVKQIFNEAKAHAAYAGLFDADSGINLQDRTIRKIVQLFENFDLSLTAFDVKGEAFEYFLGDTFTGGLGEYFTPRNVVEFMVSAIDPKIGDKIIDPFCGTGGFLIHAFEVVGEKIQLQEFSDDEKERWKFELSNRSLYGTDWKERTSLACKMNMTVHGDGSAGIFMRHGLLDVAGVIEEELFDICLTNPPFGSFETDPDILDRYELGSGRQSQSRLILAIERSLKLVKPGGWIAIVVIDGVLNNSSDRYVREYIKEHAHVRGVISLPRETFEGYNARAKTSVLLLQRKHKERDLAVTPTFFAIASNTGYAANGDQVAGNELPDILLDYREFRRTGTRPAHHPHSWLSILEDRLDAEFYSPSSFAIQGDAVTSVARIVERLTHAHAASEQLASHVRERSSSTDFVTVRVGDLVEEVKNPERLVPSATYRLLGVRWWGGGAFIREEKLGREIKANKLFRAEPGLLIYNRLFAYRGSFAILGDEHAECYASGEFPMYRVRHEILNPDLVKRYVVYCLNSPQYLQVVDRLSTGSTKVSRNRLNQTVFEAMSLTIPRDSSYLQELVDTLDRSHALRAHYESLAEQFKQLPANIASILPSAPS